MIIKKNLLEEEFNTFYRLHYLKERLSFNVDFIKKNALEEFYPYVESIVDELSKIMIMRQDYLLFLTEKYNIEYNNKCYIDPIEYQIIGEEKNETSFS